MKFKDPMCKSQLSFHFVLLALLLTATQSGFAADPLGFSNNFFVTGDYIVAGAYNMNQKFETRNGVSYAVGTINVPDQNKGVKNPGITGATSVPLGAQIVAALLYWQTVEKVGVMPGQPGSGQNGYFRPLLYQNNQNNPGPAAPGYAISGLSITSPGNPNVSWSSGGCSGGSTGKVLRTYRADVAGGLPNDPNGNPTANGSFEIRLPSTGNTTPITLGATLVVIYRIPSGAGMPQVPLNSIVIYDGDYGQSTAMLNMTQSMQGFYDADHNPISRLTHIVGSGQSNKFQTVYLSSGVHPSVPLPSLYGNKLPAFPGWYGAWDNPTWTFANPNPSSKPPIPGVLEDDSYAATQVVPSSSMQGCVSWGAVIMSTTVKNTDYDGILDSWKTGLYGHPGYCDASINSGACGGHGDPAWVDLPDAKQGQKDVFLQYDYMCSDVTGPGSCHISTLNDSLSAAGAASGGQTTYTGTFSPTIPASTVVGIAGFTKPLNNGHFTVVSSTSTQLVVNNPNGVAETDPGIATYATPGDQNYSFDPRLAVDTEDSLSPHANAVDKVVAAYANQHIVLHAIPGNAILEGQSNILCADSEKDASGNLTCPFPNEPGTVGFRYGLESIKNFSIDTQTGRIGECTPDAAHPTCLPAVFQNGKKDSYHYAMFSHGVGVPNWYLFDGSLSSVKQKGNTVTFTTLSPHGIAQIVKKPLFATATDVTCTSGRVTVAFAVSNPNLNGTFCIKNVNAAGTSFDITVPGSAMTFTYTANAEPYLAVADGQVTSMSGFSDVGGQNLVVALGYGGWGPASNPASDGNKWQTKAGTFHHELGHNGGNTHGGTFYSRLGNNPIDYTPTYEVNCKANVQTSMSYLFQFDLMQTKDVYPDGNPIMVVDYSDDDISIPTLTESQPQPKGILTNLPYANTASFQLPTNSLGTPHCDGSPLAQGEQSLTYVQFSRSDFFWSAPPFPGTGEDINFNGKTTDVMHPHNEWTGTAAEGGAGLAPGLDLRQISAIGTLSTSGAGGSHISGGGGGSHISGGGGGSHISGGGGGSHISGGGGGSHISGGGGSPSDFTHEAANSYPRPARDLVIVQEEASPRYVDLSWFGPTFGTPVKYNIYRTVIGTPFSTTPYDSVPGTQTTYQDKSVTCNAAGYSYRVTSVTTNDAGASLESSPTNTVPASGEPLLTGCYTRPVNVGVETSGVQGDIVSVTWTLTDDHYIPVGTAWADAQTGNPVTNQAANTLVAVGPDPTRSCAAGGRTTLLLNGAAQSVNGTPAGTFANSSDQFTFTLDTDVLCAGSYTFELDLDSGQTFTSSSLQLSIDVGDQEPRIITPPALPAGTVGLALDNVDVIKEDGGTAPFTWSFTGLPALPAPGVSFSPANPVNANQITLSGRTCVAGTYNINATVTDSKSNSGSQAFTLQINKANTTTGVTSNANPSVFQQMVTFTVTVTPQYGCTPTGTVTLSDGGSPISPALALSGGTATFTTSALAVAMHNITATYSGDSNFTSSNSATLVQTVNKALTQITFNSLSPLPVFVGQPTTVSYTFSVMAPGAGTPIAPSGYITVLASDHSTCTVAAVQGAGMCTLSPAPTAAASLTYSITYPGDGNFMAGGFNGNYNVYQLVFKTQPSNTGVGLAITSAVQVAAEDSGNNTYTDFIGPVTVAIGSGPGTLSGTTTQSAVAGVATFGDLSINKIANGYTLKASPSGGVPDATSNAFNIDTFYVDANGNFGTLDLPTGTVTQIGAGTAPSSSGMDLTPTLLVYEYNTSTNQLVEITPSTGAATPVGAAGSLPDPANTTTGALTDGSYFGIDMVTGNLWSINLTTGVTTSPGTTTTALVPAGCSFEASLTGSATVPVLYYTIGSTGVGTGCTVTPFTDTLYKIDPTSGATTTIGPVTIGGSGVNAFVGSAFVGGTLYGFTSDGKEYTIDPGTGVATSPVNTTPTTAIFGAGSSQ